MLSNQEDFDRDVRRVMQEVKGEEIPLDFLVDIEQRLDQMEKKKKRRMFLWFFMGIVLASGLSFGLLRENESSKTTVKNVEQNVTIQTSKPKALNQLASSKENVTIQTTKVESAAVISQPVVPRTMPSGRTEKATNPRFVRKNQTDVIPRIRPKENSATVPRQIATTKAPLNDQGISSNQKNEVSQVSETATSTPTRMDERSNPISVPVTTIPEIAPLINDVQANTNSTSINPVYPEPGILPIEKEKWVQTFGFFTGMSGIRSSVNVVDPSGVLWTNPPLVTEKYLAIRNAQERSTSSIDLSLRTSWMKHHFLIQTGVDYFEWGEQLKYDYNIVFDGVNRYSYVSIPLYLGYHQSWKKVGLSASVGSSIGGVIKRDGLYIHPDLTTMTTEQASDWTTTGYFQLELSYLLENYRFSIAPTYRKSLSTVIFSGYTVNKYDSFGLQMGISVILK
jgi:hypothetical protein